jgi:hypothetical protein
MTCDTRQLVSMLGLIVTVTITAKETSLQGSRYPCFFQALSFFSALNPAASGRSPVMLVWRCC